MADENKCVADEFQNELSRLELERVTALGEAADVQASMQSLLQHEVRRMESKLGPQHPRSQQLKARLQSNMKLTHTLELERQLFQIDVPEVADEGALVHGRIVDEDELGIDRLTVCLVDRSGAPVRDIVEPVTEASGYYSVALEPKIVDRLVEQHPDGVFLAVLTPRQRLVFQQPKPLALVRGARLLVEIRLRRADLIVVPAPEPAAVVVPTLVGQRLDVVVAILKARNLTIGTIERRPDGPKDIVLKQKPAAGTSVAAGAAIDLLLGGESEGPELRVKVVELFEQDPKFDELGISARALSNRFEKQDLSTLAQFDALLTLSDQELRDTMSLSNLRSAQIFREILRRVLEQL